MFKLTLAVPFIALLIAGSSGEQAGSAKVQPAGARRAATAQAIQPILSGKVHPMLKTVTSSVPAMQSSPTFVTTAAGPIDNYSTEWGTDAIMVHTTAPFIDLGCGLADSYETDPSNPGNHTQQAALLAAFLSGKNVQVTLMGCGFNRRGKIVGVTILR